MGIARRQRRMFKRAYDKATKLNSVTPVSLRDDPGIQAIIDKLKQEYEADTSSK